jgi:hypothetical protein
LHPRVSAAPTLGSDVDELTPHTRERSPSRSDPS